MTQTMEDPREVRPRAKLPSRQVRIDIQVLRALAVALVVIYHVWPGRVPGGFVGVDVFFVISGFLITSHLLKNPPVNMRTLGAFWARRIRRLLPAAFVVLGASLVASRLFLPSSLWEAVARETLASAVYVQNWHLASLSVDYLAAENAPSPVQHFWSLSVEEQFYILWPVLILIAAYYAGKRRKSFARAAGAMVFGVAGLSFAAGIISMFVEPEGAYFSTHTRIWELAVGGIVAVAGRRRSLRSQGWSNLAAWMGLAMIIGSAFLLTGSMPFPGWLALLPVTGTALVIWAHSSGDWSVPHLLGRRPVLWLGEVSYSLYLWHWPLIIIVPYISGGSFGPLDKVGVVICSLALAAVTKVLVEDRFRFPAPTAGSFKAFRFAMVGIAVVALASGLQLAETRLRAQAAHQLLTDAVTNSNPCFGGSALSQPAADCPPVPAEAVVPEPGIAKDDKSAAYRDGCWNSAPFATMTTCTYGSGPVRIALVGNSHAGHWLPALEPLADKNGWTITTYLASVCTATSAQLAFDTTEKSKGCIDWGEEVLERTGGGQYDLIITSERNVLPAAGATPDTTFDAWKEGYRAYLTAWADSGANVLVIKDTPFPGNTIRSIPDCVSESGDNYQECSASRDDWVPVEPLAAAAQDLGSRHVSVADFNDLLCTESRCSGVIGGVIAYFDGSHMTATYARSLAPFIEAEILARLT